MRLVLQFAAAALVAILVAPAAHAAGWCFGNNPGACNRPSHGGGGGGNHPPRWNGGNGGGRHWQRPPQGQWQQRRHWQWSDNGNSHWQRQRHWQQPDNGNFQWWRRQHRQNYQFWNQNNGNGYWNRNYWNQNHRQRFIPYYNYGNWDDDYSYRSNYGDMLLGGAAAGLGAGIVDRLLNDRPPPDANYPVAPQQPIILQAPAQAPAKPVVVKNYNKVINNITVTPPAKAEVTVNVPDVVHIPRYRDGTVPAPKVITNANGRIVGFEECRLNPSGQLSVNAAGQITCHLPGGN